MIFKFVGIGRRRVLLRLDLTAVNYPVLSKVALFPGLISLPVMIRVLLRGPSAPGPQFIAGKDLVAGQSNTIARSLDLDAGYSVAKPR